MKYEIHATNRHVLVREVKGPVEVSPAMNVFYVPDEGPARVVTPGKVWMEVAADSRIGPADSHISKGSYILVQGSMRERVPVPPGGSEEFYEDLFVVLENYVCAIADPLL